MRTVDTETHANHAVNENLDHTQAYLSDGSGDLDASSFDLVSPDKDGIFTNKPNFVSIYHNQVRGKQLSGLYKQQSKRQPPSKANRSASQSPSSLTKKMPTGTRSKGSAPDPEEIAELAKVPRRNKIPTQAKKGNDSSPSGKDTTQNGGGSLRNINSPSPPKVSKQDAAKISQTQMEIYVAQFSQADKAKSKPQLIETLLGVRKDFFVTYQMLEQAKDKKAHLLKNLSKTENKLNQLQEDHSQLQEKMGEVEKTYADRLEELQDKLERAQAAKKRERFPITVQKSDALKRQVKEQARGWLFGTVKFIQSVDEEMDAAKHLFKLGKFDKDLVNTKAKREDLAEGMKVIVKRSVFEKRNYVTSETKKLVFKRLNTPGAINLTVEDLVMCIQRNIKTEQDMEKFMVYWDDYLPRHVGASEWGERVRYYTTISIATRKDFVHMPLVNPEDEAFLVVCFQNGIDRWTKEFNEKKAKMLARGDAGVPDADGDDDQPKRKKKAGVFDGLFTKTTKGQNLWGGWEPEGLELYNQYRAMNVEARKDPGNYQLEKQCVLHLRKQRGIEESCECAEEHARNVEAKKRMKKRGLAHQTLPPKKKHVRTLMIPDSSDDESEED